MKVGEFLENVDIDCDIDEIWVICKEEGATLYWLPEVDEISKLYSDSSIHRWNFQVDAETGLAELNIYI